ncbi:MAG: GIY-YIG nuclease family protein [Patescibacteria group bacterium]|nr:GIY-YIG nuclease family protein [Patescibacteria group bacterium]
MAKWGLKPHFAIREGRELREASPRFGTEESSNPSLSAFARRSALRRTKSAKRVKAWFAYYFMWYAHILDCKNNKLHIGCADDLKNRLEGHKKGRVMATKNIRVIKLRCYFFKDKYIAFKFEKYLKPGSGRAFIKRHFV